MWFIGVEVEQETSAPLPKKNSGSAPAYVFVKTCNKSVNLASYTAMRKAVKRAERGF